MTKSEWIVWNKKYDRIDEEYGPSQLAETHAERTGYWNVFYYKNLASFGMDNKKAFKKAEVRRY